ncbi:hypothetical protein T4A_3632 [Trichinella pseudospiralis]|uniref:Uncharacterized protein n=1 Tax=Trichinella pseudospiralis TaxID=6337 RepID=A0A0V1AK27_TRIPS|nr:hypothetical protein T4A_3632 [Trichinella pseudospiralis]
MAFSVRYTRKVNLTVHFICSYYMASWGTIYLQ